jgi:nitric oxide reductase subunit B
MSYRGHWIALFAVLAGSFAILGGYAPRIYSGAPPIPERVVGPGGRTLVDGEAIRRGQGVWQAMGGQEVGSIWGHGAYVAPDWTADWLHREAVSVLDGWARAAGAAGYAALPEERQGALRARLSRIMKENGYDPSTGDLRIPAERVAAFEENARHYAAVFRDGVDAYAIPARTVTGAGPLRDLAAFFWWTSWAAVAHRPGEQVSYTQDWPHEPLVGNQPTGTAVVWSVVSFVLLLGGIGALVWWHGSRLEPETRAEAIPARDPLFGLHPTASQRATVKYFWTAAALLVVQIGLGAVVAHYGVEGSGFYGIPLAKVLPYSVARTWHTQLGIFWIATAWLATGLYVGPAVSGAEPAGQRLGVNALFGALLVIVIGSLAGQWLSVMHRLPGEAWFWFGHQGYEYVDLGRFWQIFLFVGLFLWLGLMLRALWPALRRPAETRPLLLLFVLSSFAIALFYGAGLLYGRRANLAVVEYWRWWVVHLWVEGFFEVFATVVIAFLFVRLGLLHPEKATRATFFSTTVFLAGGIVGTFHHEYFAGTPAAVMALGATFSALEVVPLTLVGLEVWQNIRLARADTWVRAYRWPIFFFVAVAFWNLVGAGLFGFFINPPIALYYMQGLNTTPLHGHAALFGVYGMLGIGLMLFCLRALRPGAAWRERPIALAFWLMNAGLLAMVLLSLLPLGIMQTWASVESGTWWARSAEFMQTPLMHALRWMRVPGDTVFAAGALVLGWFVLGLATGWSLERTGRVVEEGSTEVKGLRGEAPEGGRA